MEILTHIPSLWPQHPKIFPTGTSSCWNPDPVEKFCITDQMSFLISSFNCLLQNCLSIVFTVHRLDQHMLVWIHQNFLPSYPLTRYRCVKTSESRKTRLNNVPGCTPPLHGRTLSRCWRGNSITMCRTRTPSSDGTEGPTDGGLTRIRSLTMWWDGTCVLHTQVSCGGFVWRWSSEDPCIPSLQLTSVWNEDYTCIPSPIPRTVSTISTITCRVWSRSPREAVYPDRFETTVTSLYTYLFILLLTDLLTPLLLLPLLLNPRLLEPLLLNPRLPVHREHEEVSLQDMCRKTFFATLNGLCVSSLSVYFIFFLNVFIYLFIYYYSFSYCIWM